MKKMEIVAALGALAQDTRLHMFRLLVQAGPEGLGAGEIAARLDGVHRWAVSRRWISPYHPIAAHHAQFAALESAAHEILAGLDQNASAETRKDGADAACYHAKFAL